jgi:hypothetical protein
MIMGNTKIVGKLDSWSDASVGGQTSFMNLEEGSNIVRCVSSPYEYNCHFIPDATGQTRKVHCCLKDCPACAAAKDPKEESKPRWLVAVLNAKTNTVQVLELGPQVVKQIKALTTQKNAKGAIVWGDPRGFEIDIVRGPKGSNPLYSVVPQPKQPLTDEEKTLIRATMEKLDLQKMIEPPTPAEVCEKLGMEAVKAPAVVDDTDSPPPSDDDSESDLFDFDAK